MTGHGTAGDAAPEFSRVFDCTGLGSKRQSLQIEASFAERAALSRRFDVLAIRRLEAELDLARRPGETVEVSGRVVADVTRTCVVTLEDFETTVREEFELLYAPEGGTLSEQDDSLPLDDEEWREPIVDGNIDLGEAVAQQLSLALDPYPRSPGASFEPVAVGRDSEDELADKPLKALASLTRKHGKG